MGGAGLFMASVYETPFGRMALIADEELVGRSFYDREKGLILMIPEKLYGRKLVESEEAISIMLSSHILVLSGERIVRLAVEKGLVHPDSVTRIRGVPHAQVYKIRLEE